jgi:hypothetical protein
MVQPAANAQALDDHLNSIVQTLKDAVDSAMKKVNDDPKTVDHTLQDCEEILDHVMQGRVEEWLGFSISDSGETVSADVRRAN